ncbi:MAG: hypothetical protein M1269_10835 [Chloroflexi bacterium]|nr:hypothetical protein [Chloroflexota bacterium]
MHLFENVICFPKSAALLILLVITVLLGGCGHSQGSRHTWAPSLIFSTYLGGSRAYGPGVIALTFAQNTAADAGGNTYVTGATQVYDLPVLNAWQPGPYPDSTRSAFVAKYDPVGRLLWCTYLGGNGQNIGVGIAAMPDGGVAVAGLTISDSSGPFPTMNAYQANNNGLSDYFVTVFDEDGNMRYSTYLGGSDVEGELGYCFADDSNNGNNISVDAQGLVYFTGLTNSGGGAGAIKFPITDNAVQPEIGGLTDAFLCIIDPDQRGESSLIYSSFFGGDKEEKGHAIKVSADGTHITMVGYTKSSNFPATPNAYRDHASPPGYTSNGFVAQFTSSLPGDPSSQYTNRYATYLGADSSEARDDTYAVALGPDGLIEVTGRTESADFPMVPPSIPTIYNSATYLKPNVSGDEPYLVKIDPSLEREASLVYSTFLGGGSPDGNVPPNVGGGAFCTGIAVDSKGMAYVGGETSSLGVEYTASGEPVEAPSLFPFTVDALFPALQGSYDAILMQIDTGGATLDYSTFLGGKENDRTYGLDVDPAGNIIMSGLTFSSDFPLKNPAQTWPGNTGNQNAFITKIGR